MARAGRTFLPLDVNYFDDPKVVMLSELTVQLDIKAMLLMKRTHSDGVVTRRQLERLAPSGGDIGAMIAELIDADLYVDAVDHLTRAGWDGWNDPAADVEAMAKGGLYGNHVKWHVRRGLTKPECPFCSGSESGGDSGANPTRIAEQRRTEENRIKDMAQPSVEPEGDSASITSLQPFESDFNAAWEHYPRKVSRKAALRAYTATRRRGADPIELQRAVDHYAAAVRGRAPDKVKHGSTFFGPDEPWTDYVAGVPSADSPLPAVAGGNGSGPIGEPRVVHPTVTW